MSPVRPMLDDFELQQVQNIDVAEEQVLAQYGVPALEGDFLQRLNRRGARITLSGVLTGADDRDRLEKLRQKFRAATPVSFVADIATATRVDKVLIEELGVRELAGKPERFEYALTLREYLPASAPRTEPPPPPPPPPPSPTTGTLIVEVVVEGQPDFDFSTVTVTAAGNQDNGTALSRTLTNRTTNTWTEENFPPGQYTARAVVTAPSAMSGAAEARVRAGQTTHVTITLRPGARIAKAFVVHFQIDKAFIEPCLRDVLRRVADYAAAHTDEKLVIVGHTDLVGSDDYNQSLSERRGRSVFAYMTAGRSNADRTAAVAEWNELRQPRAGSGATIQDNWGTREYQYMLQDLGYYVGNIDEVRGPQTIAAIRAFQADHGLPETGRMDDATWPALITDYLAVDPLAVPESQFLRNAGAGCDGGPLKWLGCGLQDPVRNTRDAWRPNRRTELLFVTDSALPCQVPPPVTFNLPEPGAVGSTWCLGPGDVNDRACFLARGTAQPGKWLVQPADPGTVTVSGTITFDDGTPVANAKYTLLAPDGTYLHSTAGAADLGERPSGPTRGRPIPMRADASGNFSHPVATPVGTYIVELPDLPSPQVARRASDPPPEAVGNVVCVPFSAAPGSGNVVVQRSPVAPVTVNPTITPASTGVVVKKPHTNPARVLVTLGTSAAFPRGRGTLERSGNTGAIKLFTAATGGTEITFNGTDNVFTGRQLTAGVQLFAESDTPSGAVDDYQLRLTLTGGRALSLGPPATASLTAVEITLDIAHRRPAPGAAPPLFSSTDKVNVGRLIQVRDPGFSHERAMLIVRPPNPLVTTTLVLTPIDARVQAFTAEVPAAGQTPVPNPNPIPSGSIPLGGTLFFAEGITVSGAVRDTGFRLGIQGGENEADRVAITVGALVLTNNAAPFNTSINRVQIEGILNSNRASFDLSDLFGNQSNSLFRVRADIPGASGPTVQANLTSRRVDGNLIELVPMTVTLTRTSGDRFVSRPILAIPEAIPRSSVVFASPQDLEVIPTSSRGTIQVELIGAFADLGTARALVRGRVVHIFALAFQGSNGTTALIQQQIITANQIWAQAGVEVQQRSITVNVPPPAGLLDLDTFTGRTPFTGALTTEEQRLLGIAPNSPARSPTATDMNIYYIRSFTDPDPTRPAPPFGGMAYEREHFSVIVEPGQAGIAILGGTIMSQAVIAHELGHQLLRGWGGDEHKDQASPPQFWPLGNVMHPTDSAANVNLDRTQVANVLASADAGTHPLVHFEP